MTVYPNAAGKSISHAPAYFSPIPRAVWDLRRERRLTPRDVDVLGLLLDYKTHSTPIVDPEQNELAARLACSLDTIQRSVARLRRAGLVATQRLRDVRGRLGGTLYDLSAVLDLMPTKAAKMRSGQWGRSAPPPDGKPAPRPPAPTPQKSGVKESGQDSAVERNNTPASKADAPKEADPVLAAVVISLKDAGVFAARAHTLVQKCGEERCRAVLAAAGRVKHFRQSRAAWIVGALIGGWPLAPGPDETRPQSQWPYQAPPDARPAPADLADLSPDAYAALQQRAYDQLWTETKPAWRSTLLSGRNPAYLRTRMRLLLAAGAV